MLTHHTCTATIHANHPPPSGLRPTAENSAFHVTAPRKCSAEHATYSYPLNASRHFLASEHQTCPEGSDQPGNGSAQRAHQPIHTDKEPTSPSRHARQPTPLKTQRKGNLPPLSS